jgi:hypothetical protein
MNLHTRSRSQAQKLGLRLRLHQKVAAPPALAPQHCHLVFAEPEPDDAASLMGSELVGAESFRRSQSRKEPYQIEGAGARMSRNIWGSLSHNMM